ncbi:MAG: ABC transporter permease [Anaerolineae bacterium]|nr:ABC transporter permease [Anaerolineae bacterium]
MRKTLIVARHELLSNLMRRSFLVATFGVPVLTIGLMLLVTSITVQFAVDKDLGAIGFADESGLFSGASTEGTALTAFPTASDAQAAFEAGDLGAYFIIPADYLTSGQIALFTRAGMPANVQDQIDRFLAMHLSAGINQETVARLLNPVTLNLDLLDSGRTIGSEAAVALFIMPLLFMMIFMMALQSASSYLMSGVVEEKSNRIMEVLITSLTPSQLLRGKILGLGVLALIQVSIWVAAAALGLRLGQAVPALNGISLQADIVAWAFIFFLLDFFLLAAVMAAIGAVAGSEQESRQISGLFTLVLVLPIFFLTSFITDPNGGVALFFSLFPLTAPVAIILRLGMTTVPLEQILLSLLILTVTALAAAWVGGRVFGWSLLMYGKRPGVRAILRAIRRSGQMGTTATEARS